MASKRAISNRYVFVNRYYAPDQSATAQLLTDLAQHLAAQGRDVHIVTSRLRYDDTSTPLPDTEVIHGVTVSRVWTSRFGRANLMGRAIDYLTFYLSAFVQLLRTVHRGDTVIAKTDPPLISIVCMVACWLKGATMINWLQDLFPEVADALGVGLAKGAPGKLLRGLRNVSLRFARSNVVLGELMQERLLTSGIAPEKIVIIHNWVVGELQPVAQADNPLIGEWGLEGKFVVGYSGNLGRAHNYQTMLGAIQHLQHRPDIVFLFIGGGAGLDILKREVADKSLRNVLFKPYQPLSMLSQSLSVPDVHLITLQPELEGLIVPSKFYGVLAVGRPMVFIGDAQGEVGRQIQRGAFGTTVQPGAVEDLVAALLEERTLLRGGKAWRWYAQHFDEGHARDRWTQVLLGAVNAADVAPVIQEQ
jgi:glycosyltransferase involved in cell wall biosynthesis